MRARAVVPFTARRVLTIENAQKKGGGSTKNGRDSNAQRRGCKVYGGQPVKAGGIIYRQVGATWKAGENCDFGKDYTVYSTIEGIVIYEHKRDNKQISVYPRDHPKALAAILATYTHKPKEGVPSRQERRKAMYQPRSAQRAAAAASP